MDEAEDAANARLMAAAPVLLAHLKTLRSAIAEGRNVSLVTIQQIIANVEG